MARVCDVQVYEYTGGLGPGAPAWPLGRPLSARLGPGLLGGVFDGLLRPLLGGQVSLVPGDPFREADGGNFQPAALHVPGSLVRPGVVIGAATVDGTLAHPVTTPPDVEGRLEWLAAPGPVGADDPVAVIEGRPVTLWSSWPIRTPRPFRRRLDSDRPLVTGQRVIDLLLPVSKGSTAAVAGGFGTGKTVLMQQVAKWCDADVIVYVGCGERGNELSDTMEDLRRLEDPRTGGRLCDRTVIIANTSNMPVMAREASIYTGLTVAEWFRDQGKDAVLIADSTSRWAEALREFAREQENFPPRRATRPAWARPWPDFTSEPDASRRWPAPKGPSRFSLPSHHPAGT